MTGLISRVHPYRVVIFAAVLLGLILMLPKLQPVAFALFLTVIFALAFDAPVSALEKRGVNRILALLLVVVAFLGALVGFVLGFLPRVITQIQELGDRRGGLSEQLTGRINDLGDRLPFSVPDLAPDTFAGEKVVSYLNELNIWGGAGQALGLIVFSLFAALWAVANPVPLQQRLLGFIAPQRREQVASTARRVEERLRRWLVGQMGLNLAVGISSYILFRMLDVPFAALFAVLAAFLEMVPTVGVFLAAAGPAVMLTLEDPSKLVWLVLGIVVIQQLEDRLLVPYVMRKALDIPQTILAFVMLTFGVLFGPAGLVMAVPLTAAAFTIHDEVMDYGRRTPRSRDVEEDEDDVLEPEEPPVSEPVVPPAEKLPVPAQKSKAEAPAP